MHKSKLLIAALFFLTFNFAAHAQSKGVDTQNERIRDAGADRQPGNNGSKTNTGAGRGFDFGAGRTRAAPALPNPFRLTARRDALLAAINELVIERKMVVDEASTKLDQGVVVTQPFTFSRGATISQGAISRYALNAERPNAAYTRGRYTMIIEVTPIDLANADVAVTARIEGKLDNVVGAQWVTLESSGIAEQEFLAALTEKFGIIQTPTGN